MSLPADQRVLQELLPLEPSTLRERFKAGHPVDANALPDADYRGISLGLSAGLERLTWKKFRKVFYRDRARGVIRGWNVRVLQNGLTEPSLPMLRRGKQATYGHYVVRSDAEYAMPLPSPGGVLLDYGAGGNPRLSPLRAIRDPLVALLPGQVDLLLGYTYLDLGVARAPTPSFFLLVREGPPDHVVPAPKGPR